MKRFFNVAGPCVEGEHYMLSPVERCTDIFSLIEQRNYFVIHAARQTGKTTLLISLAMELEATGNYHPLYVSLESVQGIDEREEGIRAIARCIINRATETEWMHVEHKDLPGPEENGVNDAVRILIMRLCKALDRPLVLLFDEVDCLHNGTLITFLRQIREGYITRTMSPFAHSLALVGMRDVRDYKVSVRDGKKTLGSASPFNIKTKSLSLRNFTHDEIAALYAQHTADTSQVFPVDVIEWVFDQTQGQPWLVNAIAREMVMETGKSDPTVELTLPMAKEAVQHIILRRETHIDSLLERLKEARVRHCIEPMLLGHEQTVDPTSDDISYVLDMGLCRVEKNRLMPANPIYAEVIGRTLSWRSQYYMGEARMPFTLERFGTAEGGLDMNAMMREFQQFWRENSDVWIEKYEYKEAAPHLILMAFLQRVLNGGGHIVREFAAGRKRMDLIVELNEFRYPVEIKLRYSDKTQDEGIKQLSGYLETLGLDEGWLVIFDRHEKVSWDQKIYWHDEQTADGRNIHVCGM